MSSTFSGPGVRTPAFSLSAVRHAVWLQPYRELTTSDLRLGQWNPLSRKITVTHLGLAADALTTRRLLEVPWHEALHAIDDSERLGLPHDTIRRIAHGIVALLTTAPAFAPKGGTPAIFSDMGIPAPFTPS
jgi:hypothetical protein